MQISLETLHRDAVHLSKVKPVKNGFCFRPIVKAGGMCYIMGFPGHGKTSLVAEMVLQMAWWAQELDGWNGSDCEPEPEGAGLPMIEDKSVPAWSDWTCCGGAFKLEREAVGNILIIDGENSASSWTNLFDKLLRTYSNHQATLEDPMWMRLSRRIIHLNHESAGLSDRTFGQSNVRDLRDFCLEKGVRLLVIDPHLAIFDPEDSAEHSWINHCLRPLRNEMFEAKVSTLVIAHPAGTDKTKPKTWSPHASKQQVGTYDTAFGMWRDTEKGTIELRASKTRDIDWMYDHRSKVVLEDMGEQGAGFEPLTDLARKDWTFEPSGAGYCRLPTNPLEVFKWAPLDPEKRFTSQDIGDNGWPCNVKNRTSINKALTHLFQKGYLDQHGTAKSRGNPRLYSVSKRGSEAHNSIWPDLAKSSQKD